MTARSRLARLLHRLPQSRYPLPTAVYLRIARRASILRTLWYSWRLRGVVIVGRGCRIRIASDACLTIDRGGVLVVGLAHETTAGATILLEPRSVMHVRGFVQIMRGCQITVNWDARLTLGAGTYLNDHTMVHCSEQIDVGADCAISWNVTVIDSDIHVLIRGGEEQRRSRPISIADGCWIGTGATILKGATVHQGAVVGAGSLVANEIPSHALAVGVPARVIDENVAWRMR